METAELVASCWLATVDVKVMALSAGTCGRGKGFCGPWHSMSVAHSTPLACATDAVGVTLGTHGLRSAHTKCFSPRVSKGVQAQDCCLTLVLEDRCC